MITKKIIFDLVLMTFKRVSDMVREKKKKKDSQWTQTMKKGRHQSIQEGLAEELKQSKSAKE